MCTHTAKGVQENNVKLRLPDTMSASLGPTVSIFPIIDVI